MLKKKLVPAAEHHAGNMARGRMGPYTQREIDPIQIVRQQSLLLSPLNSLWSPSLIGGPLLARDLMTVPRQPKHFGIRAGYLAALCILIYTGAQTTFGLAPLRSLGDIASFGRDIFGVLCSVQLALILGTALLFSAGNVAQEKDRRTLILLLMTDLRAGELVIGKSLASVLPVLALIACSVPAFCFLRLLGGITLGQVLWFDAICVACCLAASAWGTLVAYWREKTFQILAITFLGAGLFLGLAETLLALSGQETVIGQVMASLSPFRALSKVLHPLAAAPEIALPTVQAWGFVSAYAVIALGLWIFTAARVRAWNPSRTLYVHAEESEEDANEAASPAPHQKPRDIWSQPVLWREICTQAYGRKVGIIKLGYFLFTVFCVLWLSQVPPEDPVVFGALSGTGLVLSMLSLASLILVNAQAVTALTSERDGQTLELLLVTEVSAKEFVFGKLGGILFNTKEVIAVPLLLAVMSYFRGEFGGGDLFCLILSYTALVLFAAMLGLHAGFSFSTSRPAILNSLGTMFFLFVGILVCMMLIVEARTSFILQLIPFLIFILGGSLGLWMSLTHQNPSPALTFCAWVLPFLTFYAIISFLLADTAAVCIAIVAAYGFTTTAMLVPAVSAFDVALGRSTLDRG